MHIDIGLNGLTPHCLSLPRPGVQMDTGKNLLEDLLPSNRLASHPRGIIILLVSLCWVLWSRPAPH